MKCFVITYKRNDWTTDTSTMRIVARNPLKALERAVIVLRKQGYDRPLLLAAVFEFNIDGIEK